MTSSAPSAEGPGQVSLSTATRLAVVVEVLITYIHVRWLLRSHDFETALERLRSGAAARPAVILKDEEPFRFAHLIVKIIQWLPTDTRCLMRSLTLIGTLAKRDVTAQLVIGVCPGETFAAHAWVELNGAALLPTLGTQFSRLYEA